MPKKTYDVYLIQRGRLWYGWTDDVSGVFAQGKTKQEAKQRLAHAIAAAVYPGSKRATDKTVDFQLREKLVLDRRRT